FGNVTKRVAACVGVLRGVRQRADAHAVQNDPHNALEAFHDRALHGNSSIRLRRSPSALGRGVKETFWLPLAYFRTGRWCRATNKQAAARYRRCALSDRARRAISCLSTAAGDRSLAGGVAVLAADSDFLWLGQAL